MDRRAKIILACVIAISIVGVLFVFVIPIGTDFHVEDRTAQNEQQYIIISEIENCNVSISFIDDASLFYAFDVHLSSAAIGSSAFSIKHETQTVTFTGSDLIESLDLTLGTGIFYNLYVSQVWHSEKGVNTTISFSNGALIDEVEVGIYHKGTLVFSIDEDVLATGDLNLDIGDSVYNTPSLVRLDINLPTGMNGVMDFNTGSSVSIVQNAGWFLRQPPYDRIKYSTQTSETSPLLNIYAMQTVTSVVAWLSN
jgi:hypothetical protein